MNTHDPAPSHDRFMPDDIDPEGLQILREAGFIWDSDRLAFLRQTAVIEYRFLREQKLVAHSSLNERERIGQLQRLRILLHSID